MRKTACPPRLPRRTAAGFTLLEVLVAIVVLSFGVLGVVGLQAASLRANNEARYQSTAVTMARELADTMRSNKNIALLTTASANPYLVNWKHGDSLPTASENCVTGTCTTPTNIAAFNMNEFLARVDAALPGVRVVVCADNDPFDASGLPQWTCSGSGSSVSMVLKLGWTRRSADSFDSTSQTNQIDQGATARPVYVFPLISGSTT